MITSSEYCGCQNSLFSFNDALKDHHFVSNFLIKHNLILEDYKFKTCNEDCTLGPWKWRWRCQRYYVPNKFFRVFE